MLLRSVPLTVADVGARRRIREIARRLPPHFETIGFECRLAAGDGAVDIGLSVRPFDALADRLAGLTPDSAVDSLVALDARWRHLREFAQRWRSEKSLRTWIPFLFLEYDASADGASSIAPCTFVALDTPLDDRRDRPHLKAAIEAASLLRGGKLPDPLRRMLVRCFDALPDGGCVLHLGLMLGRSATGVRLSVVLPAESVVPYFRMLDGDDAATSAERALDLVPRWLVQPQVDFDFDSVVQPRIGFGIRPNCDAGERWEVLFSDLEALGSCDEEKAHALLTWPGLSSRLRRDLSHAKIICTSRGLESKVYFGAKHV